MDSALAAVAAYLLGSVSFAVVVSRALGLADPRSYGSGNPGATNVLRSGNRLAAVLTLAGDAGKGWLAVWLAMLYAAPAAPAAALAVFAGHLWPLWYRFRGGKGVATAAGVLLGLDWRIGLGALAVWLVVVALFRIVSLASLAAAAFAPCAAALLLGLESTATGAVLAMAALLAWRHRDNMARLVAGAEPRLGRSRPS